MQSVKATGSVIETTLAKALWRRGHRYRKNDRSVFGVPDLTLKRHKLAIFVDSEFWHGKNWNQRKHDIKSNQDYWINKIERNIQRDKLVNKVLKQEGWFVLRFWGNDIIHKLPNCIAKIESAIYEVI